MVLLGEAAVAPGGSQACRAQGCPRAVVAQAAGRKGLAVLSKPSPAKLQITFSGRNSFRAGDARSVYKGQANSEYCK